MANFCTKCGRRLNENGMCDICDAPAQTQETVPNESQQTEQPQQSNQQAGSQQQFNQQAVQQQYNQYNSGQGYQQFGGSDAGEDFKKAFISLPKLFVRPAAEGRKLAETDSVVPGFVYIGIKTIIMLIALFVGTSDYAENLPMAQLVLFVLFTTVGVDALFALLLNCFGKVMSIKTSYAKTILAVGIHSLFVCVSAIVLYIFTKIFVAQIVSYFIIAALSLLPILEYAIFNALSDGDHDKKIRVYAIAMMIAIIAYMLVVYIISKSIVDQYVGNFTELFRYGLMR